MTTIKTVFELDCYNVDPEFKNVNNLPTGFTEKALFVLAIIILIPQIINY